MPTEPLRGKSALVTGGAHRIGREIALSLAKAGADVAITYLKSRSDAESTTREIEVLGRRALALYCDVRFEASVRQAVSATSAEFGRLDLLINNAAVFESAPLEEISLEEWTQSSRPTPAARSWLPARRSPIFAPLKAASSI